MADPRSAAIALNACPGGPLPAQGPPLQPQIWQLDDPPPSQPATASVPWLVQLDGRAPLSGSTRQHLLSSLAPTERQRLGALRHPADQERFLRARAGLRLLLARSLGCPAAGVTIETGPHGKPFCPAGPWFNISHSGDLILLALHPGHRVGVDVERLRPGLAWAAIARRVLREDEQRLLEQLPLEAREQGFLSLWCALEAELKAAGTGFSGLSRRRCGHPADAAQDIRRWSLVLPPGYLGAAVLLP